MPRQPAALKRFDDLTVEERELEARGPELHRAVQDAEQRVRDAGASRVAAEAEALRGRPDKRQAAERAEQAAHKALRDAKLRRDGLQTALQELRHERGELIVANRPRVFLPDAFDGERTVKAAAGDALEAIDKLAATARDAARRIDRLRPRDRRDGSVYGQGAALPVDLQAVRQAIALVAEQGMNWPHDVDPGDGTPITIERRQAERQQQTRARLAEAERLRAGGQAS